MEAGVAGTGERNKEHQPHQPADAGRDGRGAANEPNVYHNRPRGDQGQQTELDARLGADFKMGLGPNLTLDATFNPDFGQVEADPAEVNLSAYALPPNCILVDQDAAELDRG